MAATSTQQMYDVIIAGAGPVGLFLACELATAGCAVLILERDVDPSNEWKVFPLGMRGLNTSSVESFYRRGLMDKFFDPAVRAPLLNGATFGGHFAGIMIDRAHLDLSRWKYRIPSTSLQPGPTTLEQVQKILTERAESLGVEIIRGRAVQTIVSEDSHKIVVATADGTEYQARWLAACDGGRSAVRRAVGIELQGTEAKMTCYALHADLEDDEKLQKGFTHTKTGMYITIKSGVMYLVDYDGGAYDRTQEPSKEHLQELLTRLTCDPDVKIKNVKLASSFTDRSKIASTYHKGRVLLAGDAAHIHPPFGAQGLNLGLGDASNLGWKLAAVIRGEKDGKDNGTPLLDTYELERRPVAESVVEYTRAQVATAQPDLYGVALRKMVRQTIATPDGANQYMDRFWGLSQRYTPEDDEAHPVVGRSAPDFEFSDGTRLGSKFGGGAGLLIDFSTLR